MLAFQSMSLSSLTNSRHPAPCLDNIYTLMFFATHGQLYNDSQHQRTLAQAIMPESTLICSCTKSSRVFSTLIIKATISLIIQEPESTSTCPWPTQYATTTKKYERYPEATNTVGGTLCEHPMNENDRKTRSSQS